VDYVVTVDVIATLFLTLTRVLLSPNIYSLDGSSFTAMSFASLNFPSSFVPPWGQEFNLLLQPCFFWDWP